MPAPPLRRLGRRRRLVLLGLVVAVVLVAKLLVLTPVDRTISDLQTPAGSAATPSSSDVVNTDSFDVFRRVASRLSRNGAGSPTAASTAPTTSTSPSAPPINLGDEETNADMMDIFEGHEAGTPSEQAGSAGASATAGSSAAPAASGSAAPVASGSAAPPSPAASGSASAPAASAASGSAAASAASAASGSASATASSGSSEVRVQADDIDIFRHIFDRAEAINNNKASSASSASASSAGSGASAGGSGSAAASGSASAAAGSGAAASAAGSSGAAASAAGSSGAATTSASGSAAAAAPAPKPEPVVEADAIDPITAVLGRLSALSKAVKGSGSSGKKSGSSSGSGSSGSKSGGGSGSSSSSSVVTNADDLDPVLRIAARAKIVSAAIAAANPPPPPPPVIALSTKGPTHADTWDPILKFEDIADLLHGSSGSSSSGSGSGGSSGGSSGSAKGSSATSVSSRATKADAFDLVRRLSKIEAAIDAQEGSGGVKPGLSDYFDGVFAGGGLGNWIDRFKPFGPYDDVADMKHVEKSGSSGSSAPAGSGSAASGGSSSSSVYVEPTSGPVMFGPNVDNDDGSGSSSSGGSESADGGWNKPSWTAPEYVWAFVMGPMLTVAIGIFVYDQTDQNPFAAVTVLLACAIFDITVFYHLK